MLACGGIRRAGEHSPAILAGRPLSKTAKFPAKMAGLYEAASGFKCGESFTDRSHIVDANDLHALHG